MTYDAIVLAGGGSTRFGPGIDKARLLVAPGRTMLDQVLVATGIAQRTVVVGPWRKTVRPVIWTLEDPPAGGPVAGIAAGLAALGAGSPVVGIFSCDLLWLTAADVGRLLRGLGDHDGHGLSDASGRHQRLAAVYRRTALEAALQSLGNPRDRAVRELFAGLDLAWTDPTQAGDDVDSWDDKPPFDPTSD
jgi:molybdopterin-guanine dinucleotide biosynthesis protein A